MREVPREGIVTDLLSAQFVINQYKEGGIPFFVFYNDEWEVIDGDK